MSSKAKFMCFRCFAVVRTNIVFMYDKKSFFLLILLISSFNSFQIQSWHKSLFENSKTNGFDQMVNEKFWFFVYSKCCIINVMYWCLSANTIIQIRKKYQFLNVKCKLLFALCQKKSINFCFWLDLAIIEWQYNW